MANFRNLTDRQLAVFEQIAINKDGGHAQKTIDALFRRRLIESYQEPFTDHIGVTKITRYRVPVHVHIEWCEWRAANYQEASDGTI